MLLKDFENCVDSLISHVLVSIFGDWLDMISIYKKHVDFSCLVYCTHTSINSVL